MFPCSPDINWPVPLVPKSKRTDLLALVGDVYCILLLSHVLSWVRCGT